MENIASIANKINLNSQVSVLTVCTGFKKACVDKNKHTKLLCMKEARHTQRYKHVPQMELTFGRHLATTQYTVTLIKA